MPPKKDVIAVIRDEEHFLQFYAETNKKLSVVDIHPSWCGGCEIMQSTFRKVATEIDDFEKRMEFLSVDSEKVKGLFKNMVVTCRPKFLFLLEGRIIDEVNGANTPEIMEKIHKHIPFESQIHFLP
eukprot:TRINITY_DN8263_c0_g5_i1.p1 TRINITY_DN8263_c0_g5~~TRINITY_DN8263_c0_g5_i1.p1  ORF type:complete len:126 (+),score=32.34 TRINITY_DN8263_c0_g5_i1:138-515(+)